MPHLIESRSLEGVSVGTKTKSPRQLYRFMVQTTRREAGVSPDDRDYHEKTLPDLPWVHFLAVVANEARIVSSSHTQCYFHEAMADSIIPLRH